VDGHSIADFEADLSNILYKLWNRLASGNYFPPPVRRVDIPKDDGRTRPLGGYPQSRIALPRWVAKRALEPLVEPHNHMGMTRQIGARCIGVARQRWLRYDHWVLDLAIKSSMAWQ